MIRDYKYFFRRYGQIENDFLEITDYIEMKTDLDHCCYKVGSSKLMDFCLKVGSEIETLFSEILNGKFFDSFENINYVRNNQNVKIYIEYLEPLFKFSEYQLHVNPINIDIVPFENFSVKKSPDWFKIYSKYKHNKIELIHHWNLLQSLNALGGLLLLVINHPSFQSWTGIPIHSIISQEVFNLSIIKNRVEPRFIDKLSYDEHNEIYRSFE